MPPDDLHATLEEAVAAWAMSNPEGAAALRAEGAAAERLRMEREHEQALSQARSEGAAAEAARQRDVRSKTVPGFEALVEKLANDGRTTGQQASDQIVAAIQEQCRNSTGRWTASAPEPMEFAAASDGEHEKAPPEIDPQVLAQRIRDIQAANPGMNTVKAAAQARKTLIGG